MYFLSKIGHFFGRTISIRSLRRRIKVSDLGSVTSNEINFYNSDIRGNATSEITSPQKNYRLTLQVDITGTGNFTAQLVRRDSDRVIGTI